MLGVLYFLPVTVLLFLLGWWLFQVGRKYWYDIVYVHTCVVLIIGMLCVPLCTLLVLCLLVHSIVYECTYVIIIY